MNKLVMILALGICVSVQATDSEDSLAQLKAMKPFIKKNTTEMDIKIAGMQATIQALNATIQNLTSVTINNVTKLQKVDAGIIEKIKEINDAL